MHGVHTYSCIPGVSRSRRSDRKHSRYPYRRIPPVRRWLRTVTGSGEKKILRATNVGCPKYSKFDIGESYEKLSLPQYDFAQNRAPVHSQIARAEYTLEYECTHRFNYHRRIGRPCRILLVAAGRRWTD